MVFLGAQALVYNNDFECNLDSKIDLQFLFTLYADLYCTINFTHLETIANSQLKAKLNLVMEKEVWISSVRSFDESVQTYARCVALYIVFSLWISFYLRSLEVGIRSFIGLFKQAVSAKLHIIINNKIGPQPHRLHLAALLCRFRN